MANTVSSLNSRRPDRCGEFKPMQASVKMQCKKVSLFFICIVNGRSSVGKAIPKIHVPSCACAGFSYDLVITQAWAFVLKETGVIFSVQFT